MGAFFSSALKVGVDLAYIWWVLFVVCDLKKILKKDHQQPARKKQICFLLKPFDFCFQSYSANIVSLMDSHTNSDGLQRSVALDVVGFYQA